MRILLAAMRMDIGGAETHILELACELKKRGNFVVVASEGGVYVKTLEEHGIKHVYAPLCSKKPSSLTESYKTLAKIITEDKIDIVHSHARIPNFIIWFLRKKYHFGFVSTLHFAFTKKKFVEKFTVWGEKNLAVSEDLRRHLIRNSHVKTKDVITTVNGINPEMFSENIDTEYLYNEFPLKKDTKKIVCVCRMERVNCESMFALVRKAEAIEKKIKNVQIILVGDGEAYAELAEMAKTVNRKTKKNTVILTGARTDVNAFIVLCDVFVGISRAALEAMTAGRLVVLTGSYGHAGVLTPEAFSENMKSNFTCRKQTPISDNLVYDAVIKAFSLKKSDKDEITAKLCSLVKENYSLKRMCDDAVKVYTELMSEIQISDIVLSGYYGFSNSGDDAILKMIIKEIRSCNPNIGITILSNRPNDAKSIYSVNAVSRWNIFSIIKVLKKSKVFISGGGSVVQDVTSTKSLMYYLALIMLAKTYNNKVMLYANGIGPIKKEKNRKMAKNVLNKTDIITLRETDSKEFLQELGVINPQISVTCDPVIGIGEISKEETETLLFRYNLFGKKFIAVALRPWKSAPLFEEEFIRAANRLKKETGCELVFIPLQHPDDVEFSRKIADATNSVCIDRRLSAEMCIGIAKYSQFVVGMRLHMLIYSFVAGVPALGISYDPKVESVMKYFGEENCIGILEFTAMNFISKSQRILNGNESYREAVVHRLGELKEKNKENINCVIKLLDECDVK